VTEKGLGKIETEDYTFSVNELDGTLLCHLDVKSWSKETFKKMVGDFYEIKESLGINLYCNINKTDLKEQKIASMFGFKNKYILENTIVMGL